MSEKELERIKKEYALQLKPLIDSVIKTRRTPKDSRILKENFSFPFFLSKISEK